MHCVRYAPNSRAPKNTSWCITRSFRVGKKPFAIAGMNQHELGASLSVNLGRDAQATLLADERFVRTPYIGQHGWVTVPHDRVGKSELAALVTDSWRRVANKKQLALLETRSSAHRQESRSRM